MSQDDSSTVAPMDPGDLERIVEMLGHDDDQIAVLRGQLLVEVKLIEVLSLRFPGFEKLAPTIEFSKKLAIAKDEKLLPETGYQALMALARLRNSFSHPPLKFDITESDERRFVKKVPPHLKPLLEVYLEEAPHRSKLGQPTRRLISLLYSQVTAVQTNLRVNPASTFSEIEPPTKDWVREQFRKEREARRAAQER